MKITATQRFLDPVDPDDGSPSYTLEYTEGESYDVPPAKGHYFIGNGWADNAAKDVELSEPWNTREATEEDAERIEREIHEPARARSVVETVRFVGTGTNEVLKGDPYEGDNVRVVDLGLGGNQVQLDGTTLDVQDSKSGAGTRF